ncbi:non-homologous end-joining DNA ligase, partial [Marisediminicola senii]|uniref:non-homologous end-joining DNA ligase n=1 Tax=Marisediminicola senii TaxID=2711233 RepID=UPI0019115004
MTPTDATLVSVDGRRIRLTNLDKVLYPETGTTKADVLDYYARIAAVLVPHAADRPLTRKRWVHGVGTPDAPGQVFFQKNLDDSTPDWVRRHAIEHRTHANDYPLLNDRATLTWLGQMSAIELHVPQWRFSRTGIPQHPDRMVLDLDPGPGAGLPECAEVARLARTILLDMGLDPMPVTSGSKGIHLYCRLDGSQDSDGVSEVAHALARALEADHPDLVVSDMKKSLRDGKVLVDWSQNSANKTTIAPYSLRGRFQPTVAAPRSWQELDSPDLAQLDYLQVLDSVARRGDPLAGVETDARASLEPTPERMASFTATDASRDRLEKYRSMRDASRTPEPVPEGIAPPSSGATFVIQEHHARGLHWDFRLEYDGVLVSWALPKGVPTDPKQNHLAVQTEDHPLEYGTFEGTIPAKEYGGGEVTIWDSGTYELEKWREGKEVIVTLHSDRGARKFALIHTGGRGGGAANNWLIHLMTVDAASTPTSNGQASPAPATAPARTTTAPPARTATAPPARSATTPPARTGRTV